MERTETDQLLPDDVANVRQSVYRARRKTQPKLPKSRQETHQALDEFSFQSTNGENMIYVNDPNSGIIMFTTKTNLEYICQSEVDIFCDGTFKYCPSFYYQLYTFLGFKNGQYIPCVFFLLPAKSTPVYTKMFQFLIDTCKDCGLQFEITTLHIDFEEAVLDAARSLWPSVIIKGCHFHLSQAWWRKLQNLGLSNEYKNQDSVVGKWLKVFFGLSFLAADEVEDAIAFDIFSTMPEDEKAVAFADYVLKNYAMQDSRFPPQIWTEFNLNVKRTNNGCEAFHRQFSDMFYHPHPNIFDFMDKIRLIQTYTYLKIRASTRPQAVSQINKANLEKMIDIQQNYINGSITRGEYVKLMAYRAQPVMNL